MKKNNKHKQTKQKKDEYNITYLFKTKQKNIKLQKNKKKQTHTTPKTKKSKTNKKTNTTKTTKHT